MDTKDLFLIKPLEGFDKQIGHLLSQMNYARFTTLQAVAGLFLDQRGFLHAAEGNTIGMLLKHMAAIEF